jgi:hypothetical protein
MSGPLALPEEPQTSAPQSDIDKALSSLVNFDDLTEPAERQIKLTMMKEEAAKKKNPHKSKGLPPAATNMVGTGATLGQIQSVKPVSGF